MWSCVRTSVSFGQDIGLEPPVLLKISEARRHFGLQLNDERGVVPVAPDGKDGVRVVFGSLQP